MNASIGILLVAILVWPAHAAEITTKDEAAHDPARGAWFKGLSQPDTGNSCCDVSDCYRTQAKQLDDQSWTALVQTWHGPTWKPIPPNKVLKKTSIDGDAYVCSSMGENAHMATPLEGMGKSYLSPSWEGLIYCFVKPNPGF